MATNDANQTQESLPKVVILQPTLSFSLIGEQPFLSNKFNYLKAYESALPLHQFLAAHAPSIQAIFAWGGTVIGADILRRLPAVRLVVVESTGLNRVDLPECRRLGVKVANAGNVFSSDVADAAVGLFLDVLRKISAADRYVREGLWGVKGEYPLGFKIRGKRVGIVGLGSIGYEIAKRLEAFGCCISYNSRKRKPYVAYPFHEDVCKMAATCDALIICCALTSQTHHMINEQVLSALGKEGVIVSIGRGAIIDEKAMVRCLVQGEIAGAGLDVFDNEPEVPKELFALDNVVLSPHRAGLTVESLKDLSELVVGNLEAFFSNKPLLSEYLEE